MPAFELFQPASVQDALTLLDRYGKRRLGTRGRPRQLRLAQGPHQASESVIDLSQVKELTGVREMGGGLEIGAMTTLTEVVRHPVVKRSTAYFRTARKSRPRPRSATREPSAATYRRTRAAGITAAAGSLSRWRQHLLPDTPHCRQPGARHFRRRPVRGCESVGHGSRLDRARSPDGDS